MTGLKPRAPNLEQSWINNAELVQASSRWLELDGGVRRGLGAAYAGDSPTSDSSVSTCRIEEMEAKEPLLQTVSASSYLGFFLRDFSIVFRY